MTSTAHPDTVADTVCLGTGTHATRALGIATLVMIGWTIAFGLGFSPADRDQEDAVRIMYVHVPTVWVAYLAFVVTAACSALYLFTKKHSLGFDRVAGASAEIGVVFMALTLITGSMWGRHHVGRVLAVGRPAHHHRLAVRQLHRLPRRARPGRQPSTARQAQRRRRAAGGDRDPARALVGALVAQSPSGGLGARQRRRHRHGRSDAVQPVRRRDRVHAAVRVAGAAPHAHDGDGGPARRPRPRPGARPTGAPRRWSRR